MTARRSLVPVGADTATVDWETASAAFLERALSPGTRRVYSLTLTAVGHHFGSVPLAAVGRSDLALAVSAAYSDVAPATWNRVVATMRSFISFTARMGWVDERLADGLERRRLPEDHSRSLSRDHLERLFTKRGVSIRDRTLWRLLYETGARAEEVLRLNVEDVDLANKRAYTVRKGGDRDVLHFQTASARLLPTVIDGRVRGPLFLASRPAPASRAVPSNDLCPTTGLARLSYRRAAQVFGEASDGHTLHQLRHSAITHLAEAGVPLPLLMAKSRHASLRTLQRYARPSVEAVAALTAEHDPAARRRA
ncbi:MAG: tyrosine-type recombinase/integrase [Georgenia sp.]